MALINLRNALMAGKRTPTAKDYMQNGLIAMWDGIENAGWGVHDANATTWKDLVSNRDLTLYNGVYFADKYFVATGESGANARNGNPIPWTEIRTMEAVFAFESKRVQNYPGFLISLVQGRVDGTRVGVMLRDTSNRNVLCLSCNNGSDISFAYTLSDDLSAMSVVYPTLEKQPAESLYINGTESTALYRGYDDRDPYAVGVCFGGTTWGYDAKGKLANVRVYSRALTASEIARNYAIDKARFELP